MNYVIQKYIINNSLYYHVLLIWKYILDYWICLWI